MSAARTAQVAAVDSPAAASVAAPVASIAAEQVVARHPEERVAVEHCPEPQWDIAARSQVAAGDLRFA